MIDLRELKLFYPPELQYRERFILREYLQHRVLYWLYQNEIGRRLVFLGGTCLRIIHGNRRFSEDLNFDIVGLDWEQFEGLSSVLKNGLEQEGYSVYIESRSKGAYHLVLRFPGLLFQNGLSGQVEERILLQIDAEAQGYAYSPEWYRIERFDVSVNVACCPPSLLLAQKCYAVLNRKRNKGRDFYDIVFLLSRGVSPDWDFLELKTGIHSVASLKERLLTHCAQLSMPDMAADVRPFLFDPTLEDRVLFFEEIARQSDWGTQNS